MFLQHPSDAAYLIIIKKEMEYLNQYGWDNYQSTSHINLPSESIGRVTSITGFKYHLITQEGEITGELMGRLLTADQEEQPKVGDWVQFIAVDQDVFIQDVLPRVNSLYRKTPGNKTSRQVMATNLDLVMVVQGLDQDFNLMRLERYLVQITSCGIKAVVVLNKSDLIEDKLFYLQKIEKLGRDAQVVFCSTVSGEGLDELTQILTPGKTALMTGSSGVGKSTIVNMLLHDASQKTNEVSEATGKGMHTTTTRDMFLLSSGAILIDSPGMREFGVGLEEDTDFELVYPLIHQFALNCRYADCKHISEPGCGVLAAVDDGELDEVVYQSYLKLSREQKHFQTTIHEQKKEGKRFGKVIKEAKAFRKKYKN